MAVQTESKMRLSRGTSSPRLRPKPAVINFDGLQLVSWKHSAPTGVSLKVEARFSCMQSIAAKSATWILQKLKRKVCTRTRSAKCL